MQSQTDLRVARADLDRLTVLSACRPLADQQVGARCGGQGTGGRAWRVHAALMSPIPEINGYITLLKDTGPAARINGPLEATSLTSFLERTGLELVFLPSKRLGAAVT